MCGRLKMCMGLTRQWWDSVYTKGINERETMTTSKKYYEDQGNLSRAVSALNTSSSLNRATGVPWTREDAMAQLPAIQEIIDRREREIEALKEAMMKVELNNRFGGLDAYLEH